MEVWNPFGPQPLLAHSRPHGLLANLSIDQPIKYEVWTHEYSTRDDDSRSADCILRLFRRGGQRCRTKIWADIVPPYILKGYQSGSARAVMQAPGAPPQGNTKALVHTQFPKVMLWNFQTTTNPNAAAMRLSPVEAARFSKLYYEEGGDVTALMKVFAQRLNATALYRMKTAFDPVLLDQAVAAYATAATQAAYFAKGTAIPLHLSASPLLDYTLYEIYLEFRTGEMALSPASALAYTARTAAPWLSGAWAVGYATGTGIYYLTDYLAPSATQWLGEEIGGTWDSVFGNASATNVTGSGSVDENGIVTISWASRTMA